MKNFRVIFSNLIIGVIILGASSCEKECPDPKEPTNTTVYVATLQPGADGKDAHINSLGPSVNGGNYLSLQVRAWTVGGSNSISRSLLQFDYSSIPAGASISKATLTLYADTSTNYTGNAVPNGHSKLSGDNNWELKRVTSAWDESTVTWATVPTTDNVNMLNLPASTSASQAYVMDVTTLVKDEIASPTSYHGFLLKQADETIYRSIYFYSSDASHANLRPKMVIEYTK